jgi:hypothetical protein
MREVHNRLKVLLGVAPRIGIFKEQIYNFASVLAIRDPRQTIPCAILPNGRPCDIGTAFDLSDQDFDVIHLTVVEFAERLAAASRTEAEALEEARNQALAVTLEHELRHPDKADPPLTT